MLHLSQIHTNLDRIVNENIDLNINCNNLEEKVKLLIFRDLFRLDWTWESNGQNIICSPPKHYDKWVIQKAMSIKREEIIKENQDWINNHIKLARRNLCDGIDALRSNITPVIEVCETQKQHDLFRIFRYYWSSPYSEYVGRRLRLRVR